MKTRTIKTLLVAAVTMAAMSVPTTANAQLGGLVNKAKKKAEQVVDQKKEQAVDKGKKEVQNKKNEAKKQTLDIQRPELPWTMALSPNNADDINKLEEFVNDGVLRISPEEANDLRDKMFARYKSNIMMLKSMKESGIDDYNLNKSIENEQQMFRNFYDNVKANVYRKMQGVTASDLDVDKESANIKTDHPLFMVPAGNTTYIATKEEDGKIYFRNMLSGDRAYVHGQAITDVARYYDRFQRYFVLTKPIAKFSKEIGENPEEYGYIPYMANAWLERMREAIINNSAKNIEYKAMPKAGSMHAKFKTEALAIAKAEEPGVIDVIITSNDWDVKMKGLVPECRNIYGYYITQDKNGKICKDRMWTQKYQGNGKYGKLKAGGVGVSRDFYVK